MNVIGFSDWLSMMGTFAIVLTLLIFTLLGLKKMGPKLGNAYGKRIKVIETYSLGARQKLMLVTINKKEILLGVSPNGVSKLALLEGTERLITLSTSPNVQASRELLRFECKLGRTEVPIRLITEVIARSLHSRKEPIYLSPIGSGFNS